MSEAAVGKWGKSLTVRLPAEIAQQAGITAGEHVQIAAEDGNIVIRRAVPRYTSEELFRGRSPEEWRRLYEDDLDWEPDVGREVVEE